MVAAALRGRLRETFDAVLVDDFALLLDELGQIARTSASVTQAPHPTGFEMLEGANSMSPRPTSFLGAVHVEHHARVRACEDVISATATGCSPDQSGHDVDRRPPRRDDEVIPTARAICAIRRSRPRRRAARPSSGP